MHDAIASLEAGTKVSGGAKRAGDSKLCRSAADRAGLGDLEWRLSP